MLAQLEDWGTEVGLVPNSGVQFMDFAFDVEQYKRISRQFIERPVDAAADRQHLQLLRVPDLDDNDLLPPIYEVGNSDSFKDVTTTEALEIFLGKWVPVPFLRVKDGADLPQSIQFDQGPSNWARVRIVELPNRTRGDGASHRVVFAFDTAIEEPRPNRPYTALSIQDVTSPTVFRLASKSDDVGWFFSDTRTQEERASQPWFQGWVDDWLMACFEEYMRARYPREEFRREEMENPLEHWMRYIALLETLQTALEPPRIKLVDTVSQSADGMKPKTDRVGVDLVLDIGNSRACGLLIENYPTPTHKIDLNDALVLQLRDLGQPENVYSDPFSSHVEIAQPKFGRHDLSRRSSRSSAFFWPGMVRVGPEALRLRGENDGTGPSTGMSSPKRYIWDTDPYPSNWEFQPSDYGLERRPPPLEVQVRQRLNSSGDVIRQLRANPKEIQAQQKRGRKVSLDPATELTFSRSSFFTLMLAEILFQAIAMANSPGVRNGRYMRDAPREIRRVILTVPPATTLQERKIIDRRAEGAITLVWDLMGWTPPQGKVHTEEYARSVFVEPIVRTDLDEASCTHFVWLYGEITQKFSGAALEYARLVGKERPFAEPDVEPDDDAPLKPSIRIASIDIGGGTTDLMVTTYYVERNRALAPTQNFREGFRIAGDDLLRAVIETTVIAGIESAMTAQGVSNARNLLKSKLGENTPSMTVQERQLRRQFALKVLQPVGLSILAEHENRPSFSDADIEYRTIGALMGEAAAERMEAGERAAPEHLLAYLEESIRKVAPDFRLEDVQITLDFADLRVTADAMMGETADNLCEAIAALDVDVVLISGRPSRFPAIADLFLDRLPATPDRIITLGDYKTDVWYPFRSADHTRISDPKTCTAVGGMLCILAEQQIENFTLLTHRLSMRSTARFIGPMETTGQIKDENLLFSEINLDASPGQADDTEARLLLEAPTRIGFRQIPLERWTTTPLYRIEMPRSGTAQGAVLPFTLTINREEPLPEEEDLSAEEILRQQAERETLVVTFAEDKNQKKRDKSEFPLKLCTLQDSSGYYWLDTGAFVLK